MNASFSPSSRLRQQAGASLLEVLVALLLLSFGMLAMGVMLSFAVQMPKISGYRAVATNMAANHIDASGPTPAAFGTTPTACP